MRGQRLSACDSLVTDEFRCRVASGPNGMDTNSVTPDAILQTAFAFRNSKVLLAAITFDLFTTLGQSALTGAEIEKELRLISRKVP